MQSDVVQHGSMVFQALSAMHVQATLRLPLKWLEVIIMITARFDAHCKDLFW